MYLSRSRAEILLRPERSDAARNHGPVGIFPIPIRERCASRSRVPWPGLSSTSSGRRRLDESGGAAGRGPLRIFDADDSRRKADERGGSTPDVSSAMSLKANSTQRHHPGRPRRRKNAVTNEQLGIGSRPEESQSALRGESIRLRVSIRCNFVILPFTFQRSSAPSNSCKASQAPERETKQCKLGACSRAG